MPKKNKTQKLPKDKFFEKIDRLGEALTFDDVRLKSGYSEVMPDDINLESKFSRNIPLKIPLASAAMDTVTEHKMAIEIAKLGGIGIIHKNLTPEQQAQEVCKVKYYLNGLIDKPICVNQNETIEEILKMKEKREYSFHTFPVVSDDGEIVGIITRNDFDFCDNSSVRAKEIMTRNVITADEKTGLEEVYKIMLNKKKKALPLVGKSGKVAGMYVLKDVKRVLLKNPAGYNLDKKGQLRVGAAIGVNDFERLEKLISKNVDVVVIDTAHADTKSVINTLKKIKSGYKIDVVAGNVSESESAKRLADAGAEKIKIITTITSVNINHLHEMSLVQEELGVDFGTSIFTKVGRGIKYSYLRPKTSDLITYFRNKTTSLDCNPLTTDSGLLDISAGITCGAGTIMISVDCFGNLFPCHLLHKQELKIGNILKQDNFSEIIHNSPVIKQMQKRVVECRKCHGCSVEYFCKGGCLAHTIAANKQSKNPWLEKDPFCQVHKEILSLQIWKD